MKRSKGISNAKIESLYEFAKKWCDWWKIGRCRRGILMFYTEQPTMLRNAIKQRNL